jgi:solute carrier family 25 carnitine/acylcarnitine transporter 20/29
MDTAKNFLVGTLSGMTAVLVIQPMDMIKVRSQLSSEAGESASIMQVGKKVYGEAGALGFYKGIDSALLR